MYNDVPFWVVKGSRVRARLKPSGKPRRRGTVVDDPQLLRIRTTVYRWFVAVKWDNGIWRTEPMVNLLPDKANDNYAVLEIERR